MSREFVRGVEGRQGECVRRVRKRGGAKKKRGRWDRERHEVSLVIIYIRSLTVCNNFFSATVDTGTFVGSR